VVSVTGSVCSVSHYSVEPGTGLSGNPLLMGHREHRGDTEITEEGKNITDKKYTVPRIEGLSVCRDSYHSAFIRSSILLSISLMMETCSLCSSE